MITVLLADSEGYKGETRNIVQNGRDQGFVQPAADAGRFDIDKLA
jgi:hypothetical protein